MQKDSRGGKICSRGEVFKKLSITTLLKLQGHRA